MVARAIPGCPEEDGEAPGVWKELGETREQP